MEVIRLGRSQIWSNKWRQLRTRSLYNPGLHLDYVFFFLCELFQWFFSVTIRGRHLEKWNHYSAFITSMTPRLLSVARWIISSLRAFTLCTEFIRGDISLSAAAEAIARWEQKKWGSWKRIDKKSFAGNKIHENISVIQHILRLLLLEKELAREMRDIWDNGEGGESCSSLSSSSDEWSPHEELSESTESLWMNWLKEDTPLPSSMQNKWQTLSNNKLLKFPIAW